jgi:hypothetical protein
MLKLSRKRNNYKPYSNTIGFLVNIDAFTEKWVIYSDFQDDLNYLQLLYKVDE